MSEGAPTVVTQDAARAWRTGGILLIAATVISLTTPAGLPYTGAVQTLATAVFTASMLIFAFGFRGEGSVTARRPLGTTALVTLGVWELLAPFVGNAVIAAVDPRHVASVPWYSVDILARLALALVAAVQIARAHTIRPPWNRAPLWALAAVTVTWVATTVIGIAAAQAGPVTAGTNGEMFVGYAVGSVGFAAGFLDGAVRAGAAIFLGVVAIVLAGAPASSERAASPAD
ncbi:MAG: hypothetical protein NT132_02370 [Microbacterium sp.]|uniref:hypothetical protein n=1 Tax=Microbacterium sp. TaxID=51671 RepID=UPI002636624E|nr:hypothetical protein [Microbacterium sp.]MCX6501246.1 hypothetical protein [Microbacterium sp.]